MGTKTDESHEAKNQDIIKVICFPFETGPSTGGHTDQNTPPAPEGTQARAPEGTQTRAPDAPLPVVESTADT